MLEFWQTGDAQILIAAMFASGFTISGALIGYGVALLTR